VLQVQQVLRVPVGQREWGQLEQQDPLGHRGLVGLLAVVPLVLAVRRGLQVAVHRVRLGRQVRVVLRVVVHQVLAGLLAPRVQVPVDPLDQQV